MPSPHTNDPLHSDIPEEQAPMPTSDADAYARGREDERKAILAEIQRTQLDYRERDDAHWSAACHAAIYNVLGFLAARIENERHNRA